MFRTAVGGRATTPVPFRSEGDDASSAGGGYELADSVRADAVHRAPGMPDGTKGPLAGAAMAAPTPWPRGSSPPGPVYDAPAPVAAGTTAHLAPPGRGVAYRPQATSPLYAAPPGAAEESFRQAAAALTMITRPKGSPAVPVATSLAMGNDQVQFSRPRGDSAGARDYVGLVAYVGAGARVSAPRGGPERVNSLNNPPSMTTPFTAATAARRTATRRRSWPASATTRPTR